jgi:hypothetical protein
MTYKDLAPMGTGDCRVVVESKPPLSSQTASSQTSVTELEYLIRRGPKRAMAASNKLGGKVDPSSLLLNSRAD